MELSEVIRRRRMVRTYDPEVPVPASVLARLLEAAIRSPSAGFSQGWDFLVLDTAEDRDRFWSATTVEDAGPPDSWLAGMRTAPALLLCLSNRDAYLDRYAEPDKGWTDRDESRWPVPYWHTDTAMAALLMLLTAVDAGLGACFFGVAPERMDAVRDAFDIPPGRTIVGVLSVGSPAPDRRSPSLRRGRRGLDQVAHHGRFGLPWVDTAGTETP